MSAAITPIDATHAHRLPHCAKCKKEYDKRIPRGPIVKALLPWMPLKRYMCYKCNITKYKLE